MGSSTEWIKLLCSFQGSCQIRLWWCVPVYGVCVWGGTSMEGRGPLGYVFFLSLYMGCMDRTQIPQLAQQFAFALWPTAVLRCFTFIEVDIIIWKGFIKWISKFWGSSNGSNLKGEREKKSVKFCHSMVITATAALLQDAWERFCRAFHLLGISLCLSLQLRKLSIHRLKFLDCLFVLCWNG